MAQNYPSITELLHFSCHKIFLLGYVILFSGVIKHVEPGISLMGISLKKLKHRLFHERSLVIFCLQNWVKTHKGNNFTHRNRDFGNSDYFWPQLHAFWMINKRLNSWDQHIVKEERRAQMVHSSWKAANILSEALLQKSRSYSVQAWL